MSAREHEHDTWWSSLAHQGLLIAPTKIPEYFSEPLSPLSRFKIDRLRRGVVRMLDSDDDLSRFLDIVLEDTLGLDSERWTKANRVDAQWACKSVTGESVRPRRLWHGDRGEILPVFTTDTSWAKHAAHLSKGRGRRAGSRVIEWLRQVSLPIAVLTNGCEWQLIHAGADYHANCKWDISQWFEEGAPGPQVTALRQLLGRSSLTAPAANEPTRLVTAILESRKGQGELSAVLGERVREAVELLIHACHRGVDPLWSRGEVEPQHIYVAATRVVMRMVVILFAEARDLLPRDNPVYQHSYGIQGLRGELERAAGGRSERLRFRHAAWPRLLALFQLVYHGSGHEDLPVIGYGGGLFQPGESGSSDPVSRALAGLERVKNDVSDQTVHQVLERLTRSTVRVRQGRRSTFVEAPVDFSDLSSEYIGILYEGLLDFELRRAPESDAMVFLNVGDEPALPFARLNEMTVKELAALFQSLGKVDTKAEASPKAEPPTADGTADDDDAQGDDIQDGDDPNANRDPDIIIREMVHLWAERAVKAAKIVRYPKKDTDARVRRKYDIEVTTAATRLVRRVVLPKAWYLVRWGGTRKGSGTFYTRPQLAGPTVRRTLEPLAYQPTRTQIDPDTGHERVLKWTPRTPGEILAVRVCDPAMGSGSFLISALRYLTDALFESLHTHERISRTKRDGTIIRLADGAPVDHASNDTLTVPPDHDEFEPKLRARLQRHVVERCLYGVDLDPVAVELARLALWVETMDRGLPFEFLDHKLKCGNALVGCYFDRFQDYPLMAWEREGGDKDHKKFVHHSWVKVSKSGKRQERGDKWTQAIKDAKTDRIKPALVEVIEAQWQPSLTLDDAGTTAAGVHERVREALRRLHELPVHEAKDRAEQYASEVRDNPALTRLRLAFDAWCAIWFWPGDVLEHAPTPKNLHALPAESIALVEALAAKYRFFHWELEFPDVFDEPGAGFHAVIGNPPWDIQKPSSMEFFPIWIRCIARIPSNKGSPGNVRCSRTSVSTNTRGWITARGSRRCPTG